MVERVVALLGNGCGGRRYETYPTGPIESAGRRAPFRGAAPYGASRALTGRRKLQALPVDYDHSAAWPKVRTIRLYGVLRAQFGRVHRLAVRSTREAVWALCKTKPGFEKFMMNARDKGLTFAVFYGKRNLEKEQFVDPVGSEDIRIAPVLMGSKNSGIFQTILGAAIIAVAYINPGGFISGPTVTALCGMGASMAFGDVFQMLSPQTKTTSSNAADTRDSYYFSGAINSSAQGDPVPYGYGRMRIGSKVISSGIYSEDQA